MSKPNPEALAQMNEAAWVDKMNKELLQWQLDNSATLLPFVKVEQNHPQYPSQVSYKAYFVIGRMKDEDRGFYERLVADYDKVPQNQEQEKNQDA